MTPEERAGMIAGAFNLHQDEHDVVLAEIRAAIAQEREACAKLAESVYEYTTAAECSGECGPDAATAIRARGTVNAA